MVYAKRQSRPEEEFAIDTSIYGSLGDELADFQVTSEDLIRCSNARRLYS